jgi:two-component system alkaline phosphatase synthesis response regulator PhoP
LAKILIIEDNESLNQVYTFIFEKEGHAVNSVFNGKDGLKAIKHDTPDLILLDMLMPTMDGLTFLKKLSLPKRAKTKILVLTNLDEDEEMKTAHKLGATSYVLKATTSPSELVMRVNITLNAKA